MTQFREGQDVEVDPGYMIGRQWRKAKIIAVKDWGDSLKDLAVYIVQFPDGTRAVFDAAHVRPLSMATQLNDASR